MTKEWAGPYCEGASPVVLWVDDVDDEDGGQESTRTICTLIGAGRREVDMVGFVLILALLLFPGLREVCDGSDLLLLLLVAVVVLLQVPGLASEAGVLSDVCWRWEGVAAAAAPATAPFASGW